MVTSNAVHTLAIVEALGFVGQWVSRRCAVIQINLTVDTYKGQGNWLDSHHIFIFGQKMCYVEIIHTLCSSWTGALVCVDEVNTGASILTGL